MTTTFRPARASDAAGLSDLAARTFSDTHSEYNTPEDMRAHLTSAFGVEQQTREIADPDMVTVLAESEGELIGYTQLRRPPPAGVELEEPIEIYRFYVDRSAHGKGVAQGLMSEALAAAKEMGGETVWLGVWEKNPRAIAFYIKAGFARSERRSLRLARTDRRIACLLGRCKRHQRQVPRFA